MNVLRRLPEMRTVYDEAARKPCYRCWNDDVQNFVEAHARADYLEGIWFPLWRYLFLQFVKISQEST